MTILDASTTEDQDTREDRAAVFGEVVTSPVKLLNYGKHEIKTPFAAVVRCHDSTVNICSMCISMFSTNQALRSHMERCVVPYRAIYQERDFRLSKIQSLKTKQLLSTISQMFIQSKTVYYEVQDYDFYIIYDKEIFGYFSRYRGGNHSLNCFLVFPCFQGQGWGTVLMDISTIKRIRVPDQMDISSAAGLPVLEDGSVDSGGKSTGTDMIPFSDMRSPEKPYTRKAIMCFRKYWKYRVVGAKTVREIAVRRNISVDDAIIGLELNGFDFKKWKMTGEAKVSMPRLLGKRVYRVDK